MSDDRSGDVLAAAAVLPRGSMVIVRAREAARRRSLALALAAIAHERDLVFLVADDPALAGAIGAHGIHLPEVGAAAVPHWRARRPGWLITVSAHGLSGLLHAGSLQADAVFLSPVFPTPSHPDAAILNVPRAHLLARAARVPVYALGGIDAGNAAGLRAPFCGIAAIGALCV